MQPAALDHFKILREVHTPADCKSAIRQVENLRYDGRDHVHLPRERERRDEAGHRERAGIFAALPATRAAARVPAREILWLAGPPPPPEQTEGVGERERQKSKRQ